MGDAPFGNLRNMHQTILMDGNIDKCAKVGDIAHRSGQHHPFFQVAHLHHIGAQQRFWQLVPWVPSRLAQLGDHIPQGRLSYSDALCNLCLSHLCYPLCQLLQLSFQQILCLIAAQGQQLLGSRITLGMDAGAIERFFTLRHPQKSRTLLKRLLSQFGNLHQLAALGKAAALLPVADNVFRYRLVDACHIGQQRLAGSVQIHTHPVDTVLHHASQSNIHLLCRHIMLILPDPNRLRVDFHQLCQRVLQPPRNGNGAAQGNIKLRKFFCSQLGRRIDRGARLADHHVGYLVL